MVFVVIVIYNIGQNYYNYSPTLYGDFSVVTPLVSQQCYIAL
jgi:hypothetical protein